MPLKDILLQIDSYPDRTPDAAIDAAIGFAAAVGAELAALAVQVDIPLASNFVADRLISLTAMERDWEARSLAHCRAAIAYFQSRAMLAGVFAGAEMRRINLYETDDALAGLARTRDLRPNAWRLRHPMPARPFLPCSRGARCGRPARH